MPQQQQKRANLAFSGDIPAVVQRISCDLFLADLDTHEARIHGDIAADFDESAYAQSIWQRDRADVA
ncbi:hypothetical protein [Paraburkholderia aspalathi]|uniref:hypothetical protein n=1 Tax=Paraburkholderia aspalathi TaxID=1324617 RepID=UPI000B85873E|nr:hypothetical protein [Paraburkholderia aspalathi]